MRTVEEILQSTSETLFPSNLGRRRVAIDSHDNEGDTALHVLLWREDFGEAMALIEAGADPNAIGDMGETPLHVAIRKGAVDVVEMLLAAGADPEVRSEFGESPRQIAAAEKGAVVRLLGPGSRSGRPQPAVRKPGRSRRG